MVVFDVSLYFKCYQKISMIELWEQTSALNPNDTSSLTHAQQKHLNKAKSAKILHDCIIVQHVEKYFLYWSGK